MTSPLSQAQLALLREFLYAAAPMPGHGVAGDIALLVRAGLLREHGVGLYVATDAGRRYGASVFGKPSS